MTANTDHNPTLLDGLIEAATAMRELPKVQADLEAAMSLADETASKLSAEQSLAASLKARIAELEASLSAREADLAQATFRHEELSKVVDFIRGALPVQPVVCEPVQPVTEGEGQAQAQENPTSTTTQDTISPSPTYGEAFSPFTDSASAGPMESSGAGNPSYGAQTSPPQQAIGDDWTDPHIITQTTGDRDHQGEAVTNGPMEAPPSASNTSQPGNSPSASNEPSRRPYWQKPMSTTWTMWASSGGEVPAWVTDMNAA